MNKTFFNKVIIFLLITYQLSFVSYHLSPTEVFADSIDVTMTYKIDDQKAVDGDIIGTTNDGLVRTSTPYFNKIFGVVQDNPVIVFRSEDKTQKPVVRDGVGLVSVSNINGAIKKGDFITTSEVPGKGQKASASGYVLGTALEDFNEKNGQNLDFTGVTTGQQSRKLTQGKIRVAIRIEYAELTSARSGSRIVDYLSQAIYRNVQDPDKFINMTRYFAAIAIMITSFGVGFFAFSRSVAKGIEAIGRNPLAKNSIRFSIFMNVIMTIMTAILGIGAAILILRI